MGLEAFETGEVRDLPSPFPETFVRKVEDIGALEKRIDTEG